MTDAFQDDQVSRSAHALKQQMRDFIDYDDARESAPQEHAVTLLGSVGFALCAMRAPTRAGAVLHAMVAGALLFRAASGRDGLRRWVQARPARPAEASTRYAPAEGAEPSDPLSASPAPLTTSGF